MKTCLSILILLLTLSTSVQANELGKRYLKLGNTYRESGNYEKAEEYLLQGKTMVAGDTYWSATAHEYLGYLYRDMGSGGTNDDNGEYFMALAKEHLEQALAGFQKSVRQQDGSPSALSNLRQEVQKLSSTPQPGEEKAGSGSAIRKTTNAKIVNYDNSKLKEIPRDIPAGMENFSAAGNRISDINGALDIAKNLKYLNLKNNRVRSLEGMPKRLKKLKVLNLSGNKIKTLPQDIGDMKDLEILDLSRNKLTDIPSSITSLNHLKVLDLSGNKIPFSRIATILKAMPNTNVLFDRYELIDEEDETDLLNESTTNSGPLQGK